MDDEDFGQNFGQMCSSSPTTVRAALQFILAQCALTFFGRRGAEPGCIQFGYSGEPEHPPRYFELEMEEGLNDVISFRAECFNDTTSALNGGAPVLRVSVIVSLDCAALVLAPAR